MSPKTATVEMVTTHHPRQPVKAQIALRRLLPKLPRGESRENSSSWTLWCAGAVALRGWWPGNERHPPIGSCWSRAAAAAATAYDLITGKAFPLRQWVTSLFDSAEWRFRTETEVFDRWMKGLAKSLLFGWSRPMSWGRTFTQRILIGSATVLSE